MFSKSKKPDTKDYRFYKQVYGMFKTDQKRLHQREMEKIKVIVKEFEFSFGGTD